MTTRDVEVTRVIDQVMKRKLTVVAILLVAVALVAGLSSADNKDNNKLYYFERNGKYYEAKRFGDLGISVFHVGTTDVIDRLDNMWSPWIYAEWNFHIVSVALRNFGNKPITLRRDDFVIRTHTGEILVPTPDMDRWDDRRYFHKMERELVLRPGQRVLRSLVYEHALEVYREDTTWQLEHKGKPAFTILCWPVEIKKPT